MQPILKSKQKKNFTDRILLGMVILIALSAVIWQQRHQGARPEKIIALAEDTRIAAPVCSVSGGFHNSTFLLTFTHQDSALIYYTLDGSEPTLACPVYKAPVLIADRSEDPDLLALLPTSARWKPPLGTMFKGTVIRAISVAGSRKSKELVRTFFIDAKGAARYSLPVVALTVNPDDFFGYQRGIYVLGKTYEDKDNYIKKDIPLDLPWWSYPSNSQKRGKDMERPVSIEFYDTTGTLAFEEKAGVRISGNATRGFAQKSLRVSFAPEYGADKVSYRLFQNSSDTVFNSFILRNGGNDWDKTMFRDAFMQSLMINSKLDVQHSRPVIVFLNGEYWGVHDVRERQDENYLSNRYHIDKDSIVILEGQGDIFFGKKSDRAAFTKLLDFLKTNDLTVPANYDYARRMIDIESFIDFVIANVYFCNSDWPNNNVKFWKVRSAPDMATTGARDGRWRWMLFDTDWGFGYTGPNAVQMNLLDKAVKVGSTGIILSALLKNRDFLDIFKARFEYHLEKTFRTELVVLKINQFQTLLAPEMREHIARWRAIGTYEKWLSNVQVLRDFARERPAIQEKQLDDFLRKFGAGK